MFVGHLGAGLAARTAGPRLNLGLLFFAAMLPDFVLWLLVLAGIERGIVPPDYGRLHYLRFDFPWSHSLLGVMVLGGALALGWAGLQRNKNLIRLTSVVLALTVLSHWLLDYLVHVPEMPLIPGTRGLGLGLWNDLNFALGLELGIAFLALVWFWTRVNLSRVRRIWIGVLVLVAAALTVMGMQSPTPPPGMEIAAITSLASIAIVSALAWWADRRRYVGTILPPIP